MCAATNLAVANPFFKKGINKLITLSSGRTKTQTDYILRRHVKLKHTENFKVTCDEECAPQHRLLRGVSQKIRTEDVFSELGNQTNVC